MSGVFSELVAASEQDISSNFSDEKTFFRTMHVVKFVREYPQSLHPYSRIYCSCRGCNGRSYRPGAPFGAATISYATLPSVEMETKTEQRETAQHGFIHRMFDGIQYMFSGAPQRLILVYTFFLAAATASYSPSPFTACGEELTLKP